MKLGRLPSSEQHLKKRLWAKDYINKKLPAPPAICDWDSPAQKSISQVYGNDRYGDCVVAAGLHCIGLWTANEQNEAVFTTAQATDLYFHLTGGRDNGLNLEVLLKYWQSTGIYSHKIGPYVSVDPTDEKQIKLAISLFGSLFAGVNLPSGWENNMNKWDANAGRNIGGHCIDFSSYDEEYIYSLSWGKAIPTTGAGIAQYCDEIYAILSPDWYQSGFAPNGLDVDLLLEDLAAVKS